MDFPRIPKDLLEHLEKMFPEKCPDVETPERQVWVYTGQRSVVRLLQREFYDQNQTIINNPVLS